MLKEKHKLLLIDVKQQKIVPIDVPQTLEEVHAIMGKTSVSETLLQNGDLILIDGMGAMRNKKDIDGWFTFLHKEDINGWFADDWFTSGHNFFPITNNAIICRPTRNKKSWETPKLTILELEQMVRFEGMHNLPY